jgi:hypothetical protein
MKKLLAGLAVCSLLAIASPAVASGGSTVFTSSSPSASQVRVSFTVERNHFYTLNLFDANGVQVCESFIDVTPNHLEDGSTFSLVCSGDSVAAYSATFTVEHSTHLTPTFTWS